MGFAAMLSNGLKPKIMLAIDFRGPFCATFYARYFYFLVFGAYEC